VCISPRKFGDCCHTDSDVVQEHIEQILSQYTEPMVDVRYRLVDHRAGPVGKLEVTRDPGKLPYRVAKSIGDKKRIEQGDVFVRHGSLVVKPGQAELEAIQKEGERARFEPAKEAAEG